MQQVTVELENRVEKEVVVEELPKKKTKTIRIGHPDKGWIWKEVEIGE